MGKWGVAPKSEISHAWIWSEEVKECSVGNRNSECVCISKQERVGPSRWGRSTYRVPRNWQMSINLGTVLFVSVEKHMTLWKKIKKVKEGRAKKGSRCPLLWCVLSLTKIIEDKSSECIHLSIHMPMPLSTPHYLPWTSPSTP